MVCLAYDTHYHQRALKTLPFRFSSNEYANINFSYRYWNSNSKILKILSQMSAKQKSLPSASPSEYLHKLTTKYRSNDAK